MTIVKTYYKLSLIILFVNFLLLTNFYLVHAETNKYRYQYLTAYHSLTNLTDEQYLIESKIEYTGNLTSVRIQVENWYDGEVFSTSGDDISYFQIGDSIFFHWIEIPVSPIVFSYTILSETYLTIDQINAVVYYSFGEGYEELQAVWYESEPNYHHSADYNPADYSISIRELLRVIQFYNFDKQGGGGAYHCKEGSEDGYAPGLGNPSTDHGCTPHSSDYEHEIQHLGRTVSKQPQDWIIDLDELLRLIQIYNSDCAVQYEVDLSGEDGFVMNDCSRKKYKYFVNNKLQRKENRKKNKNEPQSLIASHKILNHTIESKIEYTGNLTGVAIQIKKNFNFDDAYDASDDISYKEFEDHIDIYWSEMPDSPIKYTITSTSTLSKDEIEAVVYYRFGSGYEQSQQVVYEEPFIVATHSCHSYTPGEILVVSNHIEYKYDFLELALNLNIPDSWTIESCTGDDLPDNYIKSHNKFIWNNIPKSPIDFSYYVNIPEDENGINKIKTNIIYKDSSNIENTFAVIPDPLIVYEAISSVETNWNLINPSVSVNDLRCLWGNSTKNVFAVGKLGDVIHYDGTQWNKMEVPKNIEFYGVWGCSDNEVFAVGDKYESGKRYYLIYSYNGKSWSEMFCQESGTLNGIWGSSCFDIFSVGTNGVVFHFDGAEWEMMDFQATEDLNDIWGRSGENVYVVGNGGLILNFNGQRWIQEENTFKDRLNAIWGDSNNIYTVGNKGTILNFNGNNWNIITPTHLELNDVWGSSKNDIYAVGNKGTICYFNGSDWSDIYNPLSGSNNRIESVWGVEGNVFASASNGIILLFDGENWLEMSNITSRNLNSIFDVPGFGMVTVGDYGEILSNHTKKWTKMNSNTLSHLNDLWGNNQDDIFAVGNNGTIIHYNGDQWSKMPCIQGEHLNAVWGSSQINVFSVGYKGKIIHFNGNKWNEISDSPVYNTECSLNDIWGSSRSDILTVGSNGTMIHFNGNKWSRLNSVTTKDLNAIWWTSENNIYVAGNEGTVLFYDGSIWSEMPTPFNDTHYDLNAIWGKYENDIFSAGGSLISSKMLHYNGNNWKEEAIPFTGTYVNLKGIYGSDNIFSVGKHGILLKLPSSLTLSFDYKTYSEGDSFFTFGDVIIDEVSENDIVINLKSSNPSEVITPKTVIISSGYTSTRFDFEIVDDSLIDGSQRINITASLKDNYSTTKEIIIHDNEKAILSIDIPKIAIEGDFLSNQGRVTTNKTVGKNTTVALFSSDRTELLLPSTITIPAGMTSTTFDLVALDDKLNDGMQIVSVNALVKGWESYSSTIKIKDNAHDFFTEIFYDEIDLNKTVLTFTPDNSTNFYYLCRNDLTHPLKTYPESNQLNLTDDSFALITLSENKTIKLYHNEYSSFSICSNGYISFIQGDSTPIATLYEHFRIPRISALSDDLKPSNANISWIQLDDKVVITYDKVEAYSGEGYNTFQIEMYYSGVIKIIYDTIYSYGSICGLSSGEGEPENFLKSDLSKYPECENLLVVKRQGSSEHNSIVRNTTSQLHSSSKKNDSAYYSINTSAQSGGKITNSDSYVAQGTDKTISIVPDDGYKIKDVFVDGNSVGPVSNYTFWQISKNHTISAHFVTSVYNTISGKVISADIGKGLGGYLVYVWNEKYQQLGMSKTDESPDNIGYYIITDIMPLNNLLMEVRPPDANAEYSGIFYYQEQYWNQASQISTLNGYLTDINFSLPRNSKFGFTGRVIDGNNIGLNNVIVNVFSENTGLNKCIHTNSTGYYYVTNLDPDESYIVSTYSNLYKKTFYHTVSNENSEKEIGYSTFIVDYARKVKPGYPPDQNIDIKTSLSTNNIQGCVMSDNLPVSGVWVNAWSPELGNGNGSLTDQNGYYVINGLSDIASSDIPIKGYIVEIDSENHLYQAYDDVDQRDSAVLVGSNTNNINFTLFPKSNESITGLITDDAGQVIEGIFIKAWSEQRQSGGNAVSNENGFYEIVELEKSNDYEVTVQPHWSTFYEEDQKTDIPSGSDNINFSIKRKEAGLYTIEGIIQDYLEQNVSGVDVEIHSNKQGFTGNAITNSSGFYKISNLPPSDDYVIKVIPDSNSSNAFFREQHISVTSNTQKNIKISFGKKISGTVYSDNNLPMKNVVITISSEKQGYYCQLLSNSNGAYTAHNVPESFDYIITATPEKHSQFSIQKKMDQRPRIGINFVLNKGGAITGHVKDATTGSFIPEVTINVYSKSMRGLYGYNTTTISNTNGVFFAFGLLSHDQHGNLLDDYVVTAYKNTYPSQAKGGKKVGDTVDFILTKNTMNELSGLVTGYASGKLSNYKVGVKIFEHNGEFLNNSIVDENGHFKICCLQPDAQYQLKFLAFVDGTAIMNQWAGKNDMGIQNRDNAKKYTTNSIVYFKFNNKLRSKPVTLKEQFSRVVRNLRKTYSISNTNPSQSSVTIRFEWDPCLPKDPDEKYYYKFERRPGYIFSDQTIFDKNHEAMNHLSIDRSFSGDEKTYYFNIAVAKRNHTAYATRTIDFQIDTVAPYIIKMSLAEYQNDQNMKLHLDAIGAFEIFISNDGFGINGQWEKYTTEKNWQINSGATINTVYCLFRDKAQNMSRQLLEIPYEPVNDKYTLDDVIKLLKILAKFETHISNFPDISNNKIIGLPEAIFILQNLSE